MQIFSNELESQPEFNGFREWLHTFELFRGKKTGDVDDDDSRIVGKFKVPYTLSLAISTRTLVVVSCNVHVTTAAISRKQRLTGAFKPRTEAGRSSKSNSFCEPCFLCRCTDRLELAAGQCRQLGHLSNI